jgi:TyrR family helix-turn-helix protein
MVIVSNNDYLQQEDLPWNIGDDVNKKTIELISDSNEMSLQESLELLEKSILERAKNKYRSTREIAEKLKINQSTVVRKLQKYKFVQN